MRKKILHLCILGFLMSSFTIGHSQSDTSGVGFITSDGDSLIHYELEEVTITAPFIIKTKRQKRKYGRLAEDIKKTYPLAKIVKKELDIVRDTIQFYENKTQQRKFMRKYESYVYETYIDSLKQLNMRQGKLFMKLISRQTGESGYELIKEYRGNFPAAFWQTMARLFGANLKTNYDPEEQAMIEDIIQRIDAGLL